MKRITRHRKDASATDDNHWILAYYLDTLVYLGNQLVTPNPLKVLNFLKTLVYVGNQQVTRTP